MPCGAERGDRSGYPTRPVGDSPAAHQAQDDLGSGVARDPLLEGSRKGIGMASCAQLDRLVEAIRHGIGEPWLRWPFGKGAELDRRMSAAATDTEGFWRNATHHTAFQGGRSCHRASDLLWVPPPLNLWALSQYSSVSPS
jgi:hypothetical protein